MTPAASSATLEEVAYVARLLARAGLVEAFGHVSARTENGFAITPTSVPLGAARAADVLTLEGPAAEPGAARDLVPDGTPLEAALHAAIYAARPDVGAICRTHSPAAVVAGCAGEAAPVAHGLGGLSSEVAFADEPALIFDAGTAALLADALGAADCLLVRGNGAVATAPGLERAAVRAWYLEERCRVWLAGDRVRALSETELLERSRHFDTEAERAWRWLRWRFGVEEVVTSGR